MLRVTIHRLLCGLLAAIVGWLAAPTAAVTVASQPLAVAYTYEAPGHDTLATHAAFGSVGFSV